MNIPKITIIMPVYRVEKFVGKAIESILAQTLSDFEFIIVDDGSPDKSGEICDDYAKKDDRIHVIHKENNGASSARNIAMRIARGKYIYFIDSDDWAEMNMLEDMYNLAETYSAQYIITGYYIDTYYSDTEYITLNVFHEDAVYYDQRSFRKDAHKLFDKNLLYTPWNKLYLADYLRENDISFPNTLWDDFPFNLSILRDIERVVVSSKQYYHFVRARTESETTKYVAKMYEKREEEHQWMQDLYHYWDVDDVDSREFLSRRYIERLVGCIENITNENCKLPKKEKKQKIKQIINNEEVKKNLTYVKPKSIMMKIMLLPIRWKSMRLTYVESLLITKVKSNHIKLFTILKAKR